jgi:hypothetical protein
MMGKLSCLLSMIEMSTSDIAQAVWAVSALLNQDAMVHWIDHAQRLVGRA